MKSFCHVVLALMLMAIQIQTVAEPLTGVANFYQYSPLLAAGGLVSPEGLAQLKASGYTHIVDLRSAQEDPLAEQSAAQAFGLNWVNLPIEGALPSAATVRQFGDLVSQGQTLVHCRSGNRVGMMWSLWQLEQGVALEQALAEGRAMGMKEGFEQAIRAQQR